MRKVRHTKGEVVQFTISFVHTATRAMLDRLAGTFSHDLRSISDHLSLTVGTYSSVMSTPHLIVLSKSYSRHVRAIHLRDFGSSMAERTEATD